MDGGGEVGDADAPPPLEVGHFVAITAEADTHGVVV